MNLTKGGLDTALAVQGNMLCQVTGWNHDSGGCIIDCDKEGHIPLLEKVQIGALNSGLKATPCNSCTIVCSCADSWPFGPFCTRNLRHKMMTRALRVQNLDVWQKMVVY